MVLLQPKLHLKLSQRQILTPGLVQMVSVLALNKLELRDMITAEIVEIPVLEELEDSVPLLDDAARARKIANGWLPKKIPSLRSKRRTRSKKLILVHSFRNISIPAIAAAARWRKSNARDSRIFFPSPPRSPTTWPGSSVRYRCARKYARPPKSSSAT